MVRTLSVVGAIVVAWSVQAISWSRAPQSADRTALLASFADRVQPGDEFAYLPGWEQGWALAIKANFPEHAQRLGRDDLLRPYGRLWLLSSSDAPSYHRPQGVAQKASFEQAGLGAVLLQREAQVEPLAWPALAGCQTSLKRKRCQSKAGRIEFTEIGLDGRFALGFKIKLSSEEPLRLTFRSAAGATLTGGLGWTAHGVRHAQGDEVRWQTQGADKQQAMLPRATGLQPFSAVTDSRGGLVVTLERLASKEAELGLSVGWWR